MIYSENAKIINVIGKKPCFRQNPFGTSLKKVRLIFALHVTRIQRTHFGIRYDAFKGIPQK